MQFSILKYLMINLKQFQLIGFLLGPIQAINIISVIFHTISKNE